MRLISTVFLLLMCAGSFNLAAQIDTLPDYATFSAYSGKADSVYVTHARYYGLFVKDTCSFQNFGTTIQSTSDCWKRIHHNYHPRFWAIGGQSPHWSIGTVVTETDALNCAAYSAWTAGGDTIEIDSIYAIDRYIMILDHNTYLGTSDSSGFRRIDPPKTVLTDTAHVGDGQIRVASNSGFRTLHKINIANNQQYDSIAGHVSYTADLSQQLTGDSMIYLSGPAIQKTMLPGDSVSLFFAMMQGPSFADADNIRMENLVFDGNRSKYALNYDWRVNSTMLFPTCDGSIIEQCRFYNMPCENVVFCGTDMIDCSGADFNGSAIHFSCSNNGTPAEVLYNRFTHLNEVGDAVMEHSEGGFTFSAKVRNFHMAYNTLYDINADGVGKFGNDDTSNVITDNLLEATGAEVGFLPFYQYDSLNTIYNNKNPNNADLSTGDCVVELPGFTEQSPCAVGTGAVPLQVGDTMHITLDSIQVRNSNENYLKAIEPIWDAGHFWLVDASLQPKQLADYHTWSFTDSTAIPRLMFDNGHRNGLLGQGNWGYELCGEPGGCRNISFSFVVQQQPMCTTEVACPLQGIQLLYDYDYGTWPEPVLCSNQVVEFDSLMLGRPVLQGADTCNLTGSWAEFQQTATLHLFPNPATTAVTVNRSSAEVSTYRIISIMGAVLQQGKLESNVAEISMEALKPGVYVLEVDGQTARLLKR